MKELLQKKINEILLHIIDKPIDSITNEDFAILAGSLRDIELKESQEQTNKHCISMLADALYMNQTKGM